MIGEEVGSTLIAKTVSSELSLSGGIWPPDNCECLPSFPILRFSSLNASDSETEVNGVTLLLCEAWLCM